MKKNLLALIIQLFFLNEAQFLNAQQAIKLADGNSASNFYWNNGKVNIGTLPAVNSHNLSIYRTMQIASVSESEPVDICKLDFLRSVGWPLDSYYGNGFSLQYNPDKSSFNIFQRVNPAGGQGILSGVLTINEFGNVGVGTSNPANKLAVRKILNISDLNSNRVQDVLKLSISVSDNFVPQNAETRMLFSAQQWYDGGEYIYGAIGAAKENDFNYGRLVFYTNDGSTNLIERMRLSNNGYLGIGTTTPDYPLDVVGIIRCHRVKINLLKTADFVFSPTYKLPSLNEVEAYIKTHKHLEGIASAGDMEKNGIEVGDMQISLLQKIEELVLYTIQLKKENEEQKNQLESQTIANENLQKQVLEMKKEMDEIKKSLTK